MSRVNKVSTAEKTENIKAEKLQTDIVSSEDSSVGTTHARRIVVSFDGSAEELQHGSEVSIRNAAELFAPEYNVAELDEETQQSMQKLDVEKGIVTGMKLLSIYSNCNDSVTLSMNLYENNPNIINKEGHLYVPQKSDMGDAHVHKQDGFINLASVLPYEKARTSTEIYSPENVISNKYIENYGGHSLSTLWEGIVPFPNKDYVYVTKDHVVLKIINQNWEMLGMSLDQEKQREGEFVKVQRSVVDSVVQQLYDSVISNIPYTNFKNLSARFQSNAPEAGQDYKVVAELSIEYTYPTIKSEE